MNPTREAALFALAMENRQRTCAFCATKKDYGLQHHKQITKNHSLRKRLFVPRAKIGLVFALQTLTLLLFATGSATRAYSGTDDPHTGGSKNLPGPSGNAATSQVPATNVPAAAEKIPAAMKNVGCWRFPGNGHPNDRDRGPIQHHSRRSRGHFARAGRRAAAGARRSVEGGVGARPKLTANGWKRKPRF
jgi:hypothetical protein